MNTVQIAGHLGADPETRFTNNGTKVTSLRVASNTRQGGKDETTWWRVSVWGDRFDRMMPHLKKGSAIIVIGEMKKPEIYNGKDGQPQVSLDLTAEMIRFSPFGRTNRDEGQQSGGFGEQTFSDDSDQGSAFGGSEAESHSEEESVPF
jgi:single-strand DNA-binding protein